MADWEQFYRDLRTPDFVPGCEVLQRLGGGAFGEVYKARRRSTGRPLAIKFLKLGEGDASRLVERELEHVRHLADLDHPNLVSIEDLGLAGGVPYLVMGFGGERTLAHELAAGPLQPRDALTVFVQVCRGVAALHARRVVHFDLKPANVFLRGSGAKVGDYGLAKLIADGRQTLSMGRGTPHYMAPEVLRSRADHRADVYSLGVLLYESLTGQPPYPTREGGLVTRDDDRPPAFPAGYPAPLADLTAACLRLDPADRPASVAEVLDRLGQGASEGDQIVLDALGVSDLETTSSRLEPGTALTGSTLAERIAELRRRLREPDPEAPLARRLAGRVAWVALFAVLGFTLTLIALVLMQELGR